MSREERSSGGMVLTVTEDTPADMLAGSMELLVQLPRDRNVHTQRVTVPRSTPMMDLLVQIATTHKLSASSYTLQAIGERDLVLSHQPNTPIGTLDALQVRLQPKQGTLAPRKAKQANQPFETTFRLQVLLPRNQLYVSRVSPKMNLGKILEDVCREKNLDKNKYELRHPANLEETLDLGLSLRDYNLQEVTLYAKQGGRLGSALSSQDIMALQRQEERRRHRAKQSVFGFMFRKSKESSLSAESLGGRSVSPARSDETGRSVSPLVAPPMRPLRKRRPAPKPPVVRTPLASENEARQQQRNPRNEHGRKMAAAEATEEDEDGEGEDEIEDEDEEEEEDEEEDDDEEEEDEEEVKRKKKLVISHSRNSSDSSGYHEASVLSDNADMGARMPETLPRRGRPPNSDTETPRKLVHTSRTSKSLGNLATASSRSGNGTRKKRAAPQPPISRPLSSAITQQTLERIVDSEESITSDIDISKSPSDIATSSKANSEIGIEGSKAASSDMPLLPSRQDPPPSSCGSKPAMSEIGYKIDAEFRAALADHDEKEVETKEEEEEEEEKEEEGGGGKDGRKVEGNRAAAIKSEPTRSVSSRVDNVAVAPAVVDGARVAARRASEDRLTSTDILLQKVSDTLSNSLPIAAMKENAGTTRAMTSSSEMKTSMGKSAKEQVPEVEEEEEEKEEMRMTRNAGTEILVEGVDKVEAGSASITGKFMPPSDPIDDRYGTKRKENGAAKYEECFADATLNSQQDTSDYVSATGDDSSITDWEYQLPAPPSAFRDNDSSSHEEHDGYETITLASVEAFREPLIPTISTTKIVVPEADVTPAATSGTEFISGPDATHRRVENWENSNLPTPQEILPVTALRRKEMIDELSTRIVSGTLPRSSGGHEDRRDAWETMASDRSLTGVVAPVDNTLTNFTITTYARSKSSNVFKDEARVAKNPTGEVKVAVNSMDEVKVMKNATGEVKAPRNSTDEMKVTKNATDEVKVPVNSTDGVKVTKNSKGEVKVPVNSSDGVKVTKNATGEAKVIKNVTREVKVTGSASKNGTTLDYEKLSVTMKFRKDEEPRIGPDTKIMKPEAKIHFGHRESPSSPPPPPPPRPPTSEESTTNVRRSRSHVTLSYNCKYRDEVDDGRIEANNRRSVVDLHGDWNLNREAKKIDDVSSRGFGDDDQLQSLRVMKSILPRLRSAQLAEDDIPDRNTSDKDGSKTQSCATSTRETSDLRRETDTPSAPLTNNAQRGNEEIGAIGKRYKYSGPPAISLGSWSERPRGEVQLKRDKDYKFAGVNDVDNITAITATASSSGSKTRVNLNATETENRPIFPSTLPRRNFSTSAIADQVKIAGSVRADFLSTNGSPKKKSADLSTHIVSNGDGAPSNNREKMSDRNVIAVRDRPIDNIDTKSLNFLESSRAFGQEVRPRSRPLENRQNSDDSRPIDTDTDRRWGETLKNSSSATPRVERSCSVTRNEAGNDAKGGRTIGSGTINDKNFLTIESYASTIGGNARTPYANENCKTRRNGEEITTTGINVVANSFVARPKTNSRMPIVKGFKLSTALPIGNIDDRATCKKLSSVSLPSPPPLVTAPIITGVTLKNNAGAVRSKSLPIHPHDPRDRLLESIRNFGANGATLKSVRS